jgi:glycosyltransferase involved in cell wall biosynthesis
MWPGRSTTAETRMNAESVSPPITGRPALRVLIVSTEFPPGPGGIGTHAHQLASQLQRLGWKVAVVTSQASAPGNDARAFNESQSFPIAVLRAPDGSLFGPMSRLRTISRWLQHWEPHVILASGQRSVWRTSWLPHASTKPWVAVGHGTEFGVTTLRERWLTRRAFERATAVVCVSQYTCARMLASGIRPKWSEVIPNGADPARFRVLPREVIERTRHELGLHRGQVLLTVGKVAARKGQDTVIRALPAVLTKFPNTVYLVVGLSGQQETFARLAAELGVADRVRFLGVVAPDDLVRYLNCCDLVVAPSRHTPSGEFEGYGIAVVEAALCGKPAVVSRDCGLGEAIIDGRTGIGVPEDDPPMTAAALVALLEDDDRRLTMGEAARIRAMHEQTWEHRAEAYDRLLRDLVAARISSSEGPARKPHRASVEQSSGLEGHELGDFLSPRGRGRSHR